MKKLIMLAVVLTTITISGFANKTNSINQKAEITFKKSFQYAEDVRWEVKDNLYKVSFKADGKEMFAYYNSDGEQVAITRHLHISQLPLALSAELKSKYGEGWLTELFELSSNGDTAYYATIESATHITTLKTEGTTGWTTFKKEKRK